MLESKRCPVCTSPVYVVRRADGAADHYEPMPELDYQHIPNPISPVLADFLRASRQGKKWVAIVGAAWTSGPWAPWGEGEVWCQNEMHGHPWCEVDGATRWFQIHPKTSFTQEHPCNHWEWLQEEHPFPIYMHQVYDDVPNSVPYPLAEIQKNLKNIVKGEEKAKKLFSSTMSYQFAQALHEGYERIELFGIELVQEGEYAYQRESLAFWMGKADGMGVEVWMPKICALFVQPLYGYEQIRQESGHIVWTAEGL